MIPLVAGVAVWVWAGTLWAGVPTAVLTYLAWCWVFPYRMCWRCEGAKWRGDGHGNQRPRFCRVCKERGRTRRLGAVLIGMVKP